MADPFDIVVAESGRAPAEADPFDAVVAAPTPQAPAAKAPAPSEPDPFDAVVAAPSKGYPIQVMPPAKDVPIEDKALAAAGDLVPDSVKSAASEFMQYVSQSPVGKTLSYLNMPLRAATAGVVYGLDKTFNPGIQKDLNPHGDFFPDLAYHDVLNYVAPTNQAVEDAVRKAGFTGFVPNTARLSYAMAKGGTGLAADFVLDPINLLLPAAGKMAGKAGKTAYKGSATVAKVADKAAELGAKAYDRSIGLFDYRTGIPDIDKAAGVASALKRGDNAELYQTFYKPVSESTNFSKAENTILSNSIELSANAATVEEIIPAVQKAAKDANLTEGRIEQIAKAAVEVKAQNASDIAERVKAGLLTEEEVGKKTIENYLVHRISPQAQKWARKNPELAAELQTTLLRGEARETINKGWGKDFDSGSFARSLKMPLTEANEAMAKATGGAVNEWFISDPLVATMMKRAETRKLVRDAELLEVIKKHAVDGKDIRAAGLSSEYRSMKHDYFDGKMVELPTQYGSKSIPFNEMYVPNKIADKIGYMIAPREVGQFSKFFDSYNQVFRTFALAKADYYLQNWGENIFKNYVAGVKISDYTDALKVGAQKAGITLKDGSKISGAELESLVTRYGIDSGGQFNEGLQSALFSGKRLTRDGLLAKTKDAPFKVLRGLRHMGESGENFSRRALFINRLKQGASVEDAVLDVEKYLFDFSRNTKATDTTRRFFDPFIQASIKTALITPELLAKNPKAYNMLHNNFGNAVAASFNDPMTQADVMQIIPDYQKFQDPILGPILTGNDWLYNIFTNSQQKPHLGGKTAIMFKVPIGLDILNRFAIWDSQSFKNSAVVSPIMKSLVMTMGGKDPFTGKSLDLVTSEPDMARRLNASLWNLVESAAPMPNTVGEIKQRLGIGNPEYFTPSAVRMIRANFGKFLTITNLDKEYVFKNMALMRAHKEIQTNLRSALMQEQGGRNSAIFMSDKGWMKDISVLANKPYTAASIFAKLQDKQREIMMTKLAGAGLMGELSAVEAVQNLREINKQVDQLNKQFVSASEYRLQSLKLLKDQGHADIEEQIVPESKAGRSTQSVGRSPQSVPQEAMSDEEAESLESQIRDTALDDGEPSDISEMSGDQIDELARKLGGETAKGLMRYKEKMAAEETAAPTDNEDELMRRSRGSDDEELALRDRLQNVQNYNRRSR